MFKGNRNSRDEGKSFVMWIKILKKYQLTVKVSINIEIVRRRNNFSYKKWKKQNKDS